MVSNAATNRTADPWPRWPLNSVEWDIFEWYVLKRVMRYERYIAAHPPRQFPAKLWLEEREGKVVRIDTAKLPIIPLKFWREEQMREHERIAEEWRQALAEAHPHAFAESPFPSDTPTRRQRLERWLDAHRGALKPWGRKKKPAPVPAPLRCSECGELLTAQEAWESNELSKILCGKCWLLQESWAN